MESTKQIEVGFINVVASPHPPGVYEQALLAIANKPYNFRGNDFAVVISPSEKDQEPDLWEGTVTIWTDIDSSEPSIDKTTFKKRDVEASLRDIFSKRDFNNRSFNFVMNRNKHRIAIELKNELGKTLSARQAGKIFSYLFSSLNKDGQTFETTVIPDQNALDTVLGLSRVDRLKIVLRRPNPGDHDGGDADEVLRELAEQNIREQDLILIKQPGADGIRLNDKNRVKAEVAAENGFVESSGLGEDGERRQASTKEYPKVVKRLVAAGTAFISALRDEAR